MRTKKSQAKFTEKSKKKKEEKNDAEEEEEAARKKSRKKNAENVNRNASVFVINLSISNCDGEKASHSPTI